MFQEKYEPNCLTEYGMRKGAGHSGRLVDLRAYWGKIWGSKFWVVLVTNNIKTIHRIDFRPYFGRKYPLHTLLSYAKLL